MTMQEGFFLSLLRRAANPRIFMPRREGARDKSVLRRARDSIEEELFFTPPPLAIPRKCGWGVYREEGSIESACCGGLQESLSCQ